MPTMILQGCENHDDCIVVYQAKPGYGCPVCRRIFELEQEKFEIQKKLENLE